MSSTGVVLVSPPPSPCFIIFTMWNLFQNLFSLVLFMRLSGLIFFLKKQTNNNNKMPTNKETQPSHRSMLLFTQILKLHNMVCVELYLQLLGKQMRQVCSLSNKLHRHSPPLRVACVSISHFLECKPH